MDRLNDFVDILAGRFDNSEQYERLQAQGVKDFPYAEHINTVCTDSIDSLPEDFNGVFMVEESYYTVGDTTRPMPHLFLFTQEGEAVKLTSWELPEGYDKTSFTAESLGRLNYLSLKESKKFTPALYFLKDGVWEGGSVSMFSPVLKFTLFERFSENCLEVTEKMEVNGKKTFGYDEPIIYKRKKA